MTTHVTEIHFTERPAHPVYGRTFDGYLVGMQNVFPTLASRYAMTSSQAIAWKVEVEKRAWEWSQAEKMFADGRPCNDRIETAVIFDNF
jgi:hypothetical protein